MPITEQTIEQQLADAILKADDPKDRVMLMLMQRVLQKVEQLLADDDALRRKVLNGDYDAHSDDHEWIKHQRTLNCHEICSWANDKMAEEKKAALVSEHRLRKVIDKAAEHTVTVLLTGIALYFGFIK